MKHMPSAVEDVYITKLDRSKMQAKDTLLRRNGFSSINMAERMGYRINEIFDGNKTSMHLIRIVDEEEVIV